MKIENLNQKRVFTFLAAVLTMFALDLTRGIQACENVQEIINSTSISNNYIADTLATLAQLSLKSNIGSIFSLAALYFIYYKFKWNRCLESIVSALLFSSLLLFGVSYEATDSWDIAFTWYIALPIFAGTFFLFYVAVNMIFSVPRLYKEQFNALNLVKKRRLFKHPFRSSLVFISAAWAPYLIFFSPGSLFPDSMQQLNSFFGYVIWTNHHPAFSTILMGSFMAMGKILGSDSIGVFLYVLFQYVVCACTFSFVIQTMQDLNAPHGLIVCTLIFYSFYTVWPAYAQCEIKDTLFFPTVLLFFLYLTKFILKRDFTPRKCDYIVFFILSVLVCLLRKNGVFFLLFSLPVCLFTADYKRRKLAIGGGCVAAISVYIVFSNVLLPNLGILKGGTQETLSIVFQQTARYVRDYSNEVTNEEKNAINGVLNYDTLADNYNPENSDPVKGTYHWAYNEAVTKPGEAEALSAYFKVWLKQFKKHPDCYIQATFNQIYQYFYPEKGPDSGLGYYLITDDPVVDVGAFNISHFISWDVPRNVLEEWGNFLSRASGIGLLYCSGTYSWILILFCFYYIFTKKWTYLLLMLPFVSLVLVCALSPVNGYMRYVLPISASIPFLTILFIRSECNGQSALS